MIVLLHGFTGSPASWDQVAAALPRSRRVLRPALMGHAGAPYTARTFDQEVDRIADLVRREATRDVHLVGYSLGARLAMGIAARHHELVGRATWISGSPGISDAAARAERLAADERRARMLETEGIAAFVDAWEREPLFASQRALDEPVRAAHRARRMAHDPRGLAACLRVLGQGAMPHYDLRTLRIPVTLIVGSEDAKARGHAQAMANSISGARVVVVPGAGHDVVLERPAEVAALLARLDTGQSAPP